MISIKPTVCLFLLMSSILLVSAQNRVPLTRMALDSLMNPKLLEGGERILSVDNVQQSVGTLSESDEPVSVHFTFTCHKETVLTRIKTFCGCTTATCGKHSFKTGEKGTITLVYQPKNHPGTINESAYVYTSDSDEYPVAKLTVLGDVRETDEWRHLPYRMGEVRLKRKTITFTEEEHSALSVERVVCANTSKYPLALSATELPEYACFHMEPDTLAPGQEGDMVVTINWSKTPTLEKEFSFNVWGTGNLGKEQIMNVVIERK